MVALSYAWRNIWRNKRRTLITLAAMAVNTAILIATFCLIEGDLKGYIRYATDLVTGEVQIHAPGYLDDNSIYKTIDNPDEIMKSIDKLGIDSAPRLYGYGLISSGNKSAGALFQGIDPSRENKTFTLSQHMMQGTFIDGGTGKGAVLGKKLAKNLNVIAGSEIIVVVQAADGSMSTDIYKVSGILKSASDTIDRGTVIINQTDFRELFSLGPVVHEIAVNSHKKYDPEVTKAMLKGRAGNLEVKTWRELNPMLARMIEQASAPMLILSTIFFTVAGLGIMNTMLMATFERIREFGILKALGATPGRIIKDILTEAVLMGVIATLTGFISGFILTWYLSVHGIDLSGMSGQSSIAGIAFNPIWKAEMSVKSFVQPVIMMWLISILAALYPAILAARLKPVEAMNRV